MCEQTVCLVKIQLLKKPSATTIDVKQMFAVSRTRIEKIFEYYRNA